MQDIKVGVIGAGGYTAGELLRILVNHPRAKIIFAQSETQANKSIASVHRDLIGEIDLSFTKDIDLTNIDVVFLCKGHTESIKIVKKYPILLNKKVIDLSADFRLKGDHSFVYGLCEFFKSKIKSADHIANPGCFATCIQLSTLPIIKAQIAKEQIHISGLTGSSGAGVALSTTSHFSWRSSNASAYKVLIHQHLKEVRESAINVNPNFSEKINFIPYRGSFTRGIITTAYFDTDISQEDLRAIYKEQYANSSFVHIIDENPDIKMVANTNKAVIHPCKIDSKAVIICAIDNLLKGASGQAVQNMNIIFNLDEKIGLNLKPSGL